MIAVAGIKLQSAGFLQLSRKAIAQKAVDSDTDAIVGPYAQEYANCLFQILCMLRQHENVNTEGQKWSRMLSAVVPYEQLN